MRLEQLQEEGEIPALDLEPALKQYYGKHMNDGTFVSWVAVLEGGIIATSGMSFVEKPPYYSNPTGRIDPFQHVYAQGIQAQGDCQSIAAKSGRRSKGIRLRRGSDHGFGCGRAAVRRLWVCTKAELSAI